MTAHPAPADPADSLEAAENRGLTPKARQALEGLPPALAALGHAFVRAGHEIALVGGPPASPLSSASTSRWTS